MASQEVRDAMFIPSDYRANFKQVIAKRSDLAQFDGGRMKYAAAGLTALYYAGLVVGYASSGADAGFYKPYNSANVDGSQVAVGILSEDVLTDEFGNGSEAAVIKKGVLFKDVLIGYDATAKAALGAHESVEHGTNLVSF